jgi:hypothetical protein
LLYLAPTGGGRTVAVVVGVGAAGLLGYARLHWPQLPRSVRRYARSLARTRARFRALAIFAAGGFAALAVASCLGAASLPAAARVGAGVAAATTLAGWACSVRR